ncbi:AAA family ATPase [Desmonostoc muscorum LEGE 12446]|uniref:AAA family ATPase n=1 Tax=Desmonostoc muscorum LEGE 12446 TaxID=1828758 RepID=A0A8J6ZSV1_DESMC|nr:AAA family ATPase [Desmonostoc muscorum]MCF2147925.1 AAA family ATPase [Desmonostoc muscorum LEGE 12446]
MQQELTLPAKDGYGGKEILDCREPIVIIGANGSGKSRLGLWIEQNNPKPEKIHRISAQRALDFAEYVQLKSLEQAEKELSFGIATGDIQSWGGVVGARNVHRWQLTGRSSSFSVTPMLNDYEQVLSLLFARKTQRDSQLAERVREMEFEGKNERPEMPFSPDETLIHIWNDILPHRKLAIKDGKITVSMTNRVIYQGREMSDGERVALYLMAQCLCAPSDSIIIIDEPEIHLHKSLISKLWSKLEEAQPNCLFVYITHDIDFAASRVGAQKIWMKNYDGENHWIWDQVPECEELPETIILEILGSRKKILFVEGQRGSLDYKLYQAIYPDFLIMPRDGCNKVIESTKAMRNNSSLHHVEVFGIIDMDYRRENEIVSLGESGIFPLKVALVENLICVPEILKVVAENLVLDFEDIYQKVSDFLINTLGTELEDQTSKRSASEIRFKLSLFNSKVKNKDELAQEFTKHVDSVNVNQIYENNLKKYQTVRENKDYKKALLLYKNKGLCNKICPILGLQSGEYRKLVVRLLSTERKDAIVSGLKNYTPQLI